MQFYHVLISCFFLSGATALIYEVVWVRLLALVFGNTVYAVGIVLTAFMSGLSLGSLLLGKLADRCANLLKLYGILETGIALFAVISPFLLDTVTTIYISTYHTSTPAWMLALLRYGLSAIALLVPTTLMGGTLPVLSRYFVRSAEELEKRVGILYAVNTVGGVVGTFMVGFFLIRYLGLNYTIKLAASLNLCIGILTFILGSKYPDACIVKGEDDAKERIRPPGYQYALLSFFFSGFSAMVYEVAWSRLLLNVIGSTTYAFSLILIGFLTGIGLGSLIVSRISREKQLGMSHFSFIQLAIGVICLFTIIMFNFLPDLMLSGLRLLWRSYSNVLLVEFLLVLSYVILPTMLFGATFPIIAGVYNDGSGKRGRNIGNIYAANTAGCILGSAVAAFLLLPYFGSTLSIKIASVTNILIGSIGFLLLKNYRFMAFSSVLLILPFMPVNASQEMLHTGVAIYGTQGDFSLKRSEFNYIYSREGLNATISIRATPDGALSLKTNGKVDASTYPDDMSTQIALGYFPLMLHADPKSILVIGLGSGVTAKVVKDFPGVENLECVEIEPAVIEAADYFQMVNGGVHRNPGMKMITDDARNHIVASRDLYDVIISEPSNPWISGIGNLFSNNFYQSSLSRLAKGGIFCQWVQLYGLRQEDLFIIMKTFVSVFPDATVWQCSGGDILLIGSNHQHDGYDYRRIEKKIAQQNNWDIKAYLYIYDAMDFISYFVTELKIMEPALREAKINTDDLPLLEFNAPYSLYVEETDKENIAFLHQFMKVPKIAETGMENGRIQSEFFYRKSRNYLKLGVPANSLWIKDALKIFPRNADYLVQSAKQSMEENQLEEGKRILQQAINIAPGNARAHYELAKLSKESPSGNAEFHFERAAAFGENDFDHLFELAIYKFRKGKLDESLDYFRRSSAVPHPATIDWRIFGYMAHGYHKKNDYTNAVIYLKKSIDVNPYNYESLVTMANLQLFLGMRGLACNYYDASLKIAPDDRKGAIKNSMIKYCPK